MAPEDDPVPGTPPCTPPSATTPPGRPSDWVVLHSAVIYPDTLRWILQAIDEQPPTSQIFPSAVESATIRLDRSSTGDHDTFARVRPGLLTMTERWPVPVSIWMPYATVDWEQRLMRAMNKLPMLEHPRIVPLLGYLSDDRRTAHALITPSLGTDLVSYLRSHPELDKHRLIIQLAEGLEYLHNQRGIVHGDLKVSSVFINRHGDAALGGLTLCTPVLKSPLDDLTATSIRQLHTLPYAAPELFFDDCRDSSGTRSKTTESDIYAFGILVYEILSGRSPWKGLNELQVMLHVTRGQRPPRPEESHSQMSDSMWYLCGACWDQRPARRPRIADVLAGLRSPGKPMRWQADPAHASSPFDLPGPIHVEHPARVPLEHPPADEVPESTLRIELGGTDVEILIPKQTPMRGGFGKVMKGHAQIRGVERVVAVKKCPTYKVPEREYSIWKSLSHKNILPLYGGIEPQVALQRGLPECVFVSPYMTKGNLVDYLNLNPQVDRLPLMMDVATGLAYLHNTVKIVHGDIKAENVLIADNGRAVLADFGLSTTVVPGPQLSGSQVREVYTLAYAAPEIIDDNAVDPAAPGVLRSKTKMSDMYAYGVLLYQAYAGGFGRNMRARILLIAAMHEGRLPKRPIGVLPVLCDDLWSICTRCWAREPKDRPSVARVLGELRDLESSPERQTIETPEPEAPRDV